MKYATIYHKLHPRRSIFNEQDKDKMSLYWSPVGEIQFHKAAQENQILWKQ